MPETIKTAEVVAETTEEVKEEVKDAEGGANPPDAAKEVKDEVSEAKEELKDPDLTEKQRDKVQARIDQLTAKIVRLETQLEEKEKASVEKEKLAKPEVTEEALIALLKDGEHPEFHDYARVELSKLYARQEAQKVRQEMVAESQIQRQLDVEAEKYPDLYDSTSPLWKRANEVFISENLRGSKNGVKMAVQLAASELGVAMENDQAKAQLQRKLDKENAKKSLAAGGKKVVVSETAAFEKLKKTALEQGDKSQAWRDWQKAIVRKTRKDI